MREEAAGNRGRAWRPDSGRPAGRARAAWAAPVAAVFLAVLLGACETRESITRKRVRAVERGLLRAVFLKGLKPQKLALENRMSFYRVPGVSLAVMDNYATEWTRAYGFKRSDSEERVTTATVFQAGPLSMPVAAALALRLAAEGGLDLQADVEGRLGGWHIPWEKAGLESRRKVTPAALLSHSAGFPEAALPEVRRGKPLPGLLDLLNGRVEGYELLFVPYLEEARNLVLSEPGYAVLERALEEAGGKGYSELAREKILTPLGLERGTFDSVRLGEERVPDAASGHDRQGREVEGGWFYHSSQAAAGLWSNPSETLAFVEDLLASAMGRGGRLLSAEAARAMLGPQTGRRSYGFLIEGSGTDVRVTMRGRTRGFTCALEVYPYKGQGAVIMANSDNGLILADEVLRALSAAYGWPDFKPLEKTPYRLDPSIYGQYVGRYEVGPGYALDIAHEDYYLVITPTGQAPTRFYAESQSFFFSVDPYIRIQFLFDAGSNVRGLVLWQEDFKLEAKKAA